MGIIVYVSNKPFVSDFNALQLEPARILQDEPLQPNYRRSIAANDMAAAITEFCTTATANFCVNPDYSGVNTADDTVPI